MCWQTVEQQSSPALAIASAVTSNFIMTMRKLLNVIILTIIVSSENIIIVPSKMTFGLFQTELPVEFNKNTRLIPTTVKITALNRVLIECQKDTFSLGRVKVVYEIDTKNCKDKNEFIEKMKNWC